MAQVLQTGLKGHSAVARAIAHRVPAAAIYVVLGAASGAEQGRVMAMVRADRPRGLQQMYRCQRILLRMRDINFAVLQLYPDEEHLLDVAHGERRADIALFDFTHGKRRALCHRGHIRAVRAALPLTAAVFRRLG